HIQLDSLAVQKVEVELSKMLCRVYQVELHVRGDNPAHWSIQRWAASFRQYSARRSRLLSHRLYNLCTSIMMRLLGMIVDPIMASLEVSIADTRLVYSPRNWSDIPRHLVVDLSEMVATPTTSWRVTLFGNSFTHQISFRQVAIR